MYDLVTVGETMLRWTPSDGLRWEQAQRFDLHVGGSESNTAVGLARLGHQVAWISRLTDNAFGRRIARSIAAHGVDVGHVIWTAEDRIGTYYFEPGSPPRDNQVIYDRAGSSFSRFSSEQLPAALFAAGRARTLHFSGISLGLGATSQKLIGRCVELARQAGWRISWDINYRAKLWPAAEARRVFDTYLPLVDLVFVPLRDLRWLWNIGVDASALVDQPARTAEQALTQWSQLCPQACTVVTLGEYGAAAYADGQFHFASTRAVPVVSRLGSGDAFAAGFLSGWLRSLPLTTALHWGNAAAQLKCSIPGDLPLFERHEVLALLAEAGDAPAHFR